MVNRIVGLASGIDIDSIVSKLMQAERMPLDKLNQKKQILEWQRDDYRTLNSQFLNFKNSLSNLKLTQQYRVRSATSSNDSLVSVNASSGAAMSSYSISNVQQLATAAKKINAGSISSSPNSKVNLDSKLKYATLANNIDWQEGAVESKNITIKDVNNITLGIDSSTSLVKDDQSGLVDTSLMNLKINGISYTIKNGTPPADTSTIGANEVYVDSTGKLIFNQNDTNIKAGTTIQVDYVTDSKVDTTTLSKDTKEWQLSKNTLSSFTSLTIGTDQYSKGNQVDSNTFELTGAAGVIGTINMSTGKVTFNDGVISDDNTSVKAVYKEEYTNFNIQTATSAGTKKQNFILKASDSLNGVINKVNNSNLGVSMFYDSFSDQLTMSRTETGNYNGGSQKMLDTDPGSATYGQLINNDNYDPKNPKDQEIITSGSFIDDVLKFGNVAETGGEDAVFTVNGLQTTRHANNFQMNGVEFTLKQTFTSSVNVSLANDTDKIFDNIKAFVDQYNALIDAVNQKTSEQRYRDYAPLTDDQRQQMTDKQQEQWDEKAKSGLLKGDSILTGALSQMRTLIYSPVSNGDVSSIYNQLSSIGITTSPDYTQGGKLEINEDKLKKALQDDPNSVENLFRVSGDTSSSKGIVQRLYDSVSGTINQLNDRAGKSYSTNKSFTIGRSLDDLNSQISAFNNKLTQIENRYYAQFNAMDQAIQNANSQSSYLASYFSSK